MRPEALPLRYHAAWDRLVANLRGDPEILGATVSGSVLRGEGGPTSDLDAYVLVKGSARRRATYLCEGVLVEEFRNPEPWIRRYLASAEGDPPAFHMLGYGAVVVDRDPAFGELRAAARAAYDAGPRALSAEAARWQRYLVWDGWCDVKDLLSIRGDPGAALGLMQLEVWRAVDTLFALNRRWSPKRKRALAAVGDVDPAIAADLVAFWRGPWAEAASAFEPYDRIVRRVLAPHDPDVPMVWASDPQALPGP